MPVPEGIGAKVKKALAWSLLNNLLIRLGNFAIGIMIARIVAPEEFGAFAVAITVQAILIALAEMGLSSDLVRNGRIRERAGTATIVALAVSGLLTMCMILTAGPVSASMGAVEARPVLQVMSMTLLISGLSVVPYARLQRDFRQRAMLAIDGISLVVGLLVTVGFVWLGLGAMALALSRVIAQAVVCVMQYGLTRMRPTLAFEPAVARAMLGFGTPIALANVLSWLVMNAGHLVVGRLSGALMLGFYVLAFNISSWPMSALGQAIRAVALPGFSHLGKGHDRSRVLANAVALTWAVSLLIGVLLAVLATGVVSVVYGDRWMAASTALAGLALFGALRIVFDVFATYLIAEGATRSVLVLQVLWLVALLPALAVGVSRHGLAGAGWAQTVVSLIVLLPAYLVALRRAGVLWEPMLSGLTVPLLGAVPAALVGWYVYGVLPEPIVALPAAGFGATATYLLVLGLWLRRKFGALDRRRSGPVPEPAQAQGGARQETATVVLTEPMQTVRERA
ncbi:polysaccharide transporter, PST family [Micromonospora phaseoli]|uniref:Polysaccharide transporter, PST family n=2 Tax=Micromonospora phaseoli TaxID=1144548 RepID=A0A1H6T1I8_9ACTN|nr:PST family polysaccharide transporter [Micromonospora phaseoli]SEI73921.1 polysaccharide transporter, PST family [Micromonospora phaseoli]